MRTIQLFGLIFCVGSSSCTEMLPMMLLSKEGIKTKENTKIVGGHTIEVEQASFVALVMYKRRPHCGGSILSTTCVLTASHCIDNPEKTALYKIKTGTASVYEGETHQVKVIIKHPDYKGYNYDFDFAIIKIVYPMAFSEKQRPIALVENDGENPKTGEGVRVYGWGDTLDIFESTDYLRVVDLKVIDHEKCEQQYKSFQMKIRTNKICAAHPEDINGKDACQGDSGGPLQSLVNGKLCGVVSFGLGCAKISHAGVYARVDSAREWIRECTGV